MTLFTALLQCHLPTPVPLSPLLPFSSLPPTLNVCSRVTKLHLWPDQILVLGGHCRSLGDVERTSPPIFTER